MADETRRLLVQRGDELVQTVAIDRPVLSIGRTPENLTGILVTHEHSDHVKGARVFSSTAQVPIFMSEATRVVCNFPENGEKIQWGETIASSEPFQIGSLSFHPFTIPHDGVDTFALTVESEGFQHFRVQLAPHPIDIIAVGRLKFLGGDAVAPDRCHVIGNTDVRQIAEGDI